MRILIQTLLLFMLFIPGGAYAAAEDAPPRPAIASAHPLATQAGMDILEQGGNAFDAAIAVSAALGVVEPYSSGLGGGGFWLLFDRATDDYVMIDAREIAPAAAHKDMFLGQDGLPDANLSRKGALSAGIPGNAAAFAHIAKKYGRLALKQSLAPAIRLARDGFAVGPRYLKGVSAKHEMLSGNPAAAAIFLDNGEIPEEGWVLKQPDLADTLEAIATNGAAGFYDGDVAAKLVSGVTAQGGIWSLDDLSAYQVKTREPVIGAYGDMRVISAALPSSGGITMLATLNILSGLALDKVGDPAQRVHFIVEALRRAYADRARYLGDPDFADIPVEKLLSEAHAQNWLKGIPHDSATVSVYLPPSEVLSDKGMQTTHFSILDSLGNRAGVTQSINFWFGSGIVPPGTGVLLNNEMDDFTAAPGSANGFGLVQSEFNAIAPHKRMLSSMTPTFLESERGMAILGTPGGSRIISMVLLASLAWEDGATAEEMVKLPRFHHQYLPDHILFEPEAFDDATRQKLENMGHRLKPGDSPFGNMNVVTWDYETGKVTAATDPRGTGKGRVY